jgi:hypothetical protein
MDFGVVFPTTQIGTDPAVIRDFAQTAEGLGYRRLLVYDHVLGAVHADRDPPLPGPYTEHDPFHEPAGYHGVPDVQVDGPAAHIAALGEFLHVVRG